MRSSNKLTVILFSLFVLFIVFLNSSNACTCRRMTYEQYLNHSDYSCTFKVIESNEKHELHSVYYKAHKLECEKVNEDAEPLLGANITEPIILRTSNQESTCGINLTAETTYKIMGQVTSDEILVFLCNYVKQIDQSP